MKVLKNLHTFTHKILRSLVINCDLLPMQCAKALGLYYWDRIMFHRHLGLIVYMKDWSDGEDGEEKKNCQRVGWTINRKIIKQMLRYKNRKQMQFCYLSQTAFDQMLFHTPLFDH